MVKFRISVVRVLLFMIFLIVFALPVFAVDAESVANPQSFLDWLLNNWEFLALGLSELLAVLPFKQKGIVKILLFLLNRLRRLPTSHSKS